MSLIRRSIKESVQGGSQALDHGVLNKSGRAKLVEKAFQLHVLLRQTLGRLVLSLLSVAVNAIEYELAYPAFIF